MSKIVRIENLNKQSFNLMIETGNFAKRQWRTLSQGVIAFNYGYITTERSAGTFATYHLLLYVHGETEDDGWIFRLNDFGDFWSENDGGEGILAENCGLAFIGGYIKWEVVKIPVVS